MTSRPTTPTTEVDPVPPVQPSADPGLDSTIVELEQKLKDLESRFLGKESFLSSVQSPFTPISTLQKRIEHLKHSLSSPSVGEGVQTKLPLIPLPVFDGVDLENFLKEFERWLRLSGVDKCSQILQLVWLIPASSPKVKRIVERLVEESGTLGLVLEALAQLFPKLENDITLRDSLEKIPQLPPSPEPAQVKKLFVDFEEVVSKMSPEALGSQEKFLLLVRKLHPRTFQDMRLDRHYKRRTETFEELKSALLEKAQEHWLDRHIFQQKRQVLHILQEPAVASSPPSSGKGPENVPSKGKG